MRRLGIYFFYDRDGQVDDYNLYLLRDLSKSLDRLAVVVNGRLNGEGADRFRQVTGEILIRENEGFDVWAYRTALETIGWETVTGYDELVLLNFTNFGPVWPFEDVFSRMAEEDCDFWGLTAYHTVGEDPFGLSEYGYLPEHIQSHFVVIRRSMLRDPAFREYWDGMPPIRSYAEAVALHEARMTRHFSNLGFRYRVYADLDREEEISYPLMTRPLAMVSEHRCPVFKRKLFTFDYDYFLLNSGGEGARELLDYLARETEYPLGLVWQNLLRTTPAAELAVSCQSMHILPPGEGSAAPVSAALLGWVASPLGLRLFRRHAGFLPEGCSVLLAMDSPALYAEAEQVFRNAPRRVILRLTPPQEADAPRERGLLLLWELFHEEAGEAELLCLAIDSRPEFAKSLSGYDSALERGFDCVLPSPAGVSRVAALFAEEPWLGLLCAPQESASFYYTRYGLYQFDWVEVLSRLQPLLGISAPISREVEPVRPAEGFCWLRTSAVRTMLDGREGVLRLLQEQLPDSDARRLALECLLSAFAQSAGFSSGWVMGEKTARAEAVNLSWYLRGLNRAMFPHCEFHDHVEVRERLARTGGVTERAIRHQEQAQGNERADLRSRVTRLRRRRPARRRCSSCRAKR